MKNLMDKMQSIIRITTVVILYGLLSCQPKTPATGVTAQPEPVVELPDWITKDFVMGHFEPREHPDFVIVDKQYADVPERILHKETYEAFKKMYVAALVEGHKLEIRSATRNFEYQKGIWMRKWTGATKLEGGLNAATIQDPVERAKKILLYSSMPGTSRHHWGTDIDLNSFENEYFKSGDGLKLYNWLVENASRYGFCQSYTDKSDGRTGYEEERWHWSYIPLAGPLTEYCRRHIDNEMITGFEGSEVATTVDMLNNYILGIDVECSKGFKQ